MPIDSLSAGLLWSITNTHIHALAAGFTGDVNSRRPKGSGLERRSDEIYVKPVEHRWGFVSKAKINDVKNSTRIM